MNHWRDDAACLDADPEVFFPADYRAAVGLDAARDYCRRCPVQEDCLDLVMPLPDLFDTTGVFAGLTPRERRDLRRSDVSLVVEGDLSLLRGGRLDGGRERHLDDERGRRSA